MATKAELMKECEKLRQQLEKQSTAIRVTADGRVEEVNAPQHGVKRIGRIVTVIISTKH